MTIPRGQSVFELSDKAVEQIIFAMEDQEQASVVDLESGEILPAAGLSDEGFAKPPTWSSREGFRLMEEFLSSVRQPTARRELSAALARGRGVFKAFKAALASYEEVERAFRDFKIRAMRRTIAVWYDDLREARGLARLGPEPEDTDELLATDLEIRILGLAAAKELVAPLLDEAEEESLENLPGPVAAYEIAKLRAEIASASDALCAIAEDGEGGALGAALGFHMVVGDRGFGRISFLMVRREFRRMGMGTTLLGALTKAFEREGINLVMLDSAFLPPELAASLAALGFVSYGLRSLTRQD
jgi:ribosomal protein S18 acetylase RimI-like enzyme